jgi:hypothetical protein
MHDANLRCLDVAVKFARLMAAIETAGAQASIEMNARLVRVQHQARIQFANVERTLEHLRNADEETWQVRKTDLEGGLEDLSRAIKNIVARLS